MLGGLDVEVFAFVEAEPGLAGAADGADAADATVEIGAGSLAVLVATTRTAAWAELSPSTTAG